MLLVAKGIKAHGIRGDVKVECFLDTPNALAKIKHFIINGILYKIDTVKPFGAYALVKFEGIDTMSQAENFRGVEMFVKKNEMPAPPKGSYYIDDLIGCSIYLNNEKIGILTDILQNGSADVYVVESGTETIMFPLIDKVVNNIDIDKKEIYLNKDEFDKVAVYED
jgi:16S rRNA processing protein RimM